ncbi:MAG TPA: hypothetical protein VHB51_00515 [Candidatus Saccharimonadales bacterium]|nr:hypothetical protein [Candidatus Saccharimonadales bacterium]
MSEGAPNLLEPPEHLALPEAKDAEPLRDGEPDPEVELAEQNAEHLEEEAREEVAEAEATNPNPLDKIKQITEEAIPKESIAPPSGELKTIAARRELQRIQHKLPAVSRTFSRVIHQPLIRAVSQVADQTVSRPSGLLGGGVVAFLGTTVYLYLAKHIGFNYNYLVFLALFIGGFIVGLALELAVWMATRSRRRGQE